MIIQAAQTADINQLGTLGGLQQAQGNKQNLMHKEKQIDYRRLNLMKD